MARESIRRRPLSYSSRGTLMTHTDSGVHRPPGGRGEMALGGHNRGWGGG